jgi:uncharacterized protein (TIGR03435 family)
LAVALTFSLAGQKPSFEVATIKPNDPVKNPGGGWGWSATPSGLRVFGTLHSFIKQAYGVEDTQIVGGPNWIDREAFEINAKASAPVSAKELWPMLQTLLAERFALAMHRETRQLPVYSLVVAKSGSKLQQGDAASPSFTSGATLLRGTMDTAALAGHLTATLGRTVIDNTGLNGTWKFSLTWAAEDQTDGPSIFTALQEQLGLKLESTKGPVQVFVIDHAEPPSEN